ncbi:MAG: 50S ribosomal protein L25 [Chloroflexota bacterium]
MESKNAVELQAEPRSITGKRVKHLRRQGLVPGHIYGKGQPTLVQVSGKDLNSALSRAGLNTLLSLVVRGGAKSVILRGVERDPLTGAMQHVDIQEVALDEPIRAPVPIVTVGESPAATGPVMVLRVLEHLAVEGLPSRLPHNITVDIGELTAEKGAIHVKDLDLPAGVKVLADPEEVIVKLTEAPEEVVEVPEVPEEVAAAEAEAELGAVEEETAPQETAPNKEKPQSSPTEDETK